MSVFSKISYNGETYEVKDIEARKRTEENIQIFNNITVPISSWVSDPTYQIYPYRADIECEGITSEYVADITFNVDEVASGVFAPISLTEEGIISIYASSKPVKDIIIPTIKCVKEVSVE